MRGLVALPFASIFLIGGCASNSQPTAETETTMSSSGTAQATDVDRQQEAELRSEHDDRMMECMRDQGFDVEEVDGPDGGWELTNPNVDDETYIKLMSECSSLVGEVPEVPVGPAEAEGMYELVLNLVDCLEAEGISVSEVPSRELWVESMLAGEAPWSPYSDPQVYATYAALCPQPTLADLK